MVVVASQPAVPLRRARRAPRPLRPASDLRRGLLRHGPCRQRRAATTACSLRAASAPTLPERVPRALRGLLSGAAGVAALALAADLASAVVGVCGCAVPAAVGGLVATTAALLLAPAAGAARAAAALAPAAGLLDRYTGLIFVPYVVSLFAGGLPAKGELVRALGCCVTGWLVVAVTTGVVVSAAERAITADDGGDCLSAAMVAPSESEASDSGSASTTLSAAVSFLERAFGLCACAAVCAALGAAGAAQLATGSALAPLTGLAGTGLAYRLAQRVPAALQRYGLFPTVTAGIAVGTALLCHGGVAAVESYMGSAGAWLLALVTPSIVACGLKVWAARAELRARLLPLALGLFTGVPLGMVCGALLARAFGLSEAVGLASIAKNTTSGLAVEIAQLFGTSPGLACAACVVSGTLGLSVLPALLDALRIRSPLARGVAAGASSHGAGTLGLASIGEVQAAAFASTTFALGGALGVALAAAAPWRAALRALAGY